MSSSSLNGPLGPTRGPRFSGGYQFPRTHAARLSRGSQPIRVERLGDSAYAQILPMHGSPLVRFEVSGQWTARGRDGGAVQVQSSSYARDELEATSLFVQLMRTILRERVSGVDAVA